MRTRHLLLLHAVLLLSLSGLLLLIPLLNSRDCTIGEISRLRTANLQLELTGYITPIMRAAEAVARDKALTDWLEGTGSREALDRYLKKAIRLVDCEAIDIASGADEVVYQSAGTTVKMDPEKSRDQWYYDLLNSPEESNIELFYDSLEGILYIYYNVKIFNPEGQYLGVLGATIRYNRIAGILEKYKDRGVTAYLIDEAGNISIHPDQRLIGEVPIYDYFGFLQKSETASQEENKRKALIESGQGNITYIEALDSYLITEQKKGLLFWQISKPEVIFILLLLGILLVEFLFYRWLSSKKGFPATGK